MSYALGIALAIGAGCAINLGTVLQKKAVNEVPPEKRDKNFMRTLLHNRTWLLGLLIQVGLGTTMVIIAQLFIGPALLPGLLATGLIAMAIGAAKIVGEKLSNIEMVTIGIIILATILLCFTGLSVEILEVNMVDPAFLIRETIFTAVFFGIIGICEIIRRQTQKYHSILFAIQSGCFLSLANYWVSPVSSNVMHLFGGTLQMPLELITGILGIIMLILTNIMAISMLQNGFKTGKANTVIPIQQVPINIAPIFVYFGIFAKASPSNLAIPFMLTSIILIVISSYILAKRQIQLEMIK